MIDFSHRFFARGKFPRFYSSRQERNAFKIHDLVEFPGNYLVVQAICRRDIFSYYLIVKTSGEIGRK
jgi:hypothetical protein